MRTTTNFSTTAGDDTYTLPSLLKQVHSIFTSGSTPRPLEFLDRRTLNKVMPLQTRQDLPSWYDLFTSESGLGVLRLFPIPAGVETFNIDYYRRMVIPCKVSLSDAVFFSGNVNIISIDSINGATIGSRVVQLGKIDSPLSTITDTFHFSVETAPSGNSTGGADLITIGGDSELLDCPEDYVEGIIAWATQHYLMNTAGSPRLDYWTNMANVELQKAIKNNQDTTDAEILLLPPSAYDNTFLSPNDIRWAELGW